MSTTSELNIGAIFVSNKIVKDGCKPGWMYREQSINEGDSGWRVFFGEEDENYLNDPSNISLITAEQLIEIDEEVAINLLVPVGYSFERDSDTDGWVIIDEPS